MESCGCAESLGLGLPRHSWWRALHVEAGVQGHLQRDCWALHAPLQQMCVQGSQRCPALTAPQALLCPTPLRQRRPTPHLPPARPYEQTSRARPPHSRQPAHRFPLRAGAKQPAAGLGRRRARAQAHCRRPAAFPRQREIEVLRPVRCRRFRGELVSFGSVFLVSEGSGFRSPRLSDVGVEEGGERVP